MLTSSGVASPLAQPRTASNRPNGGGSSRDASVHVENASAKSRDMRRPFGGVESAGPLGVAQIPHFTLSVRCLPLCAPVPLVRPPTGQWNQTLGIEVAPRP